MDEASATPSGRRPWILVAGCVAAVVAVAVVVVVAAIAVLVVTRDTDEVDAPSTAALAVARVDDNDGRAYVGTIDDAADPQLLRRALRAEFRSDATRADPRGSAAASRRCARELRRTAGRSRGTIVVLADATYAEAPAVVVGITDRGRVVVFVADADTCVVRMAQSL